MTYTTFKETLLTELQEVLNKQEVFLRHERHVRAQLMLLDRMEQLFIITEKEHVNEALTTTESSNLNTTN